MSLSDVFRTFGDTIEQSACRLRTEEEDHAVHMCMLMRAFIEAGAGEMRINPISPSQNE